MPKIALLLSGLPRLWRQCLPSQLIMFPGAELDVYCHFWDVIGADEKAELLALLKPKACVFETPRDFSAQDQRTDLIRDNINVPSRIVSQYTSWLEVGRLFAPHAGGYDLAARSRTDLQFVYNFTGLQAQLKKYEIYLPWWEKDKFISDLFALGGTEPILWYHRLLEKLEDYAKTVQFNPETLLATHFARRPDIKIYMESQRAFFVRRPHMAGYTLEQCMGEHPGQNKWLNPEVVQTHEEFFRARHGEQGAEHVERFKLLQLQQLEAAKGSGNPGQSGA